MRRWGLWCGRPFQTRTIGVFKNILIDGWKQILPFSTAQYCKHKGTYLSNVFRGSLAGDLIAVSGSIVVIMHLVQGLIFLITTSPILIQSHPSSAKAVAFWPSIKMVGRKLYGETLGPLILSLRSSTDAWFIRWKLDKSEYKPWK